MTATITQSWNRTPYKHGRSVVYVDCSITELVDKEFYTKHKIWDLNFKCKTWSAVKRLASKYATVALQPLFPNDAIKYSDKAGCSCGCSPGYHITHNGSSSSKDIWVSITHDEDTLNKVRNELVVFEDKLQREIFAHKENAA